MKLVSLFFYIADIERLYQSNCIYRNIINMDDIFPTAKRRCVSLCSVQHKLRQLARVIARRERRRERERETDREYTRDHGPATAHVNQSNRWRERNRSSTWFTPVISLDITFALDRTICKSNHAWGEATVTHRRAATIIIIINLRERNATMTRTTGASIRVPTLNSRVRNPIYMSELQIANAVAGTDYSSACSLRLRFAAGSRYRCILYTVYIYLRVYFVYRNERFR